MSRPERNYAVMKTKEELNALKKEVAAMKGKITELSEDELAEVNGGYNPGRLFEALVDCYGKKMFSPQLAKEFYDEFYHPTQYVYFDFNISQLISWVETHLVEYLENQREDCKIIYDLFLEA